MDKANVIIITLDECKASAMSPYGNTSVITPTAERAAHNGVMFENAFTCHPKCVPSRCCLFSGRYVHTNGHRTLPGFELRKGEKNLASILKAHGYATGMFGGNHTVEEEYKPEVFDEYTTEFQGGESKDKDMHMPLDDPMHRSFYRGQWGSKFDVEPHDYYTAEESIDFIKRHKDEPFLLYTTFSFPHPYYYELEPYPSIIRDKGIKLPPKHSLENAPDTLKWYRKAYDLESLADSDWERVAAAYYSMVSYVDKQAGRIYDAVRDCGLEDDTIIVYTSDHGDFSGEHGCAEKFDTLFYECIVKIPLYIQYSKLLPAGIKLNSLVENVDILPTILDMLQIPIPSSTHGKSILPYMLGRAQGHKEEVFCEGGVEEAAIKNAPHYDSPEAERMKPAYYWKQIALVDYPLSMQRAKMIRTKEWKLIYRQNGCKELYNLLENPEETINRAGDANCREIVFELMEKLIQWMMRTEPDEPKIDKLFA